MTSQEYKALREKLSLTQDGLASRLGVARKTINARENGAKITEEAALAIRHLSLDTVYILSKLWTNPTEKHHAYAIGYDDIGFTTSKEEAERAKSEAGVLKDCGWPVFGGQEYHKISFTEIKRFTQPQPEPQERSR